MKRLIVAIAGLLAIPFMLGAPTAQAQDYPSRPITIVVPLAPGSGWATS